MTKREQRQRDEIKRTLIDMYAGVNGGRLPSENPEDLEYYLSSEVGIEDWCRWIRACVRRLCPIPDGAKVDEDALIPIYRVPQWDTINTAVEEVLRLRGVIADRASRASQS